MRIQESEGNGVMDDACFAGVTPKRNEIDADGVRISYASWGDRGRDVVMLHGITSSAMTWWHVAPELARLGYRVTAPDMPGHGDSAGADRNYGLSETARIVDAFMSGLELRSPIVIGHSWGGGVALVHATASASQVEPGSIVLVDPLLSMPVVDAAEYRQALSEHLGKPRREQADRLRDAHPRWHTCDVYWKAEALEKSSPQAVHGVFRENIGLDLLPELRSVAVPWALVVADPAQGGILPHTLWQDLQMAAAGGQGQLYTMPGVGHDIHREDFAGFMANLQRFLRSCG